MNVRYSTLLACLGACLLTAFGCGEAPSPTAPVPSALVGTWIDERAINSEFATTTFSLTIQSSGRFEWRAVSVAIAPDVDRGKTVTTFRRVGGVAVRAQHVAFRSESLYTGGQSGVESVEPIPQDSIGWFGPPSLLDAEYAILGDVLQLRYTTYPVDAPVLTRARFVRAR